MSLSNGASHVEEDEDEEEQGEKFEFDDGDDIGPPERSSVSLMKSDRTADTAVSNLYAQTDTGQETAGQGMNGSTSTGQKDQKDQKDQNSPLYHQSCTGKCSLDTTGTDIFK